MPRVSDIACCTGMASPNSTSRLRPLMSSERNLRKRPPMSQSSASSRRNHVRSRSGARPQNRLTGISSGSNAMSSPTAAVRARNASGMRRSIRCPKKPVRRSRKISESRNTGLVPAGRCGSGRPRSRQTYSSTARSITLRFSSAYTGTRPAPSRDLASSGSTDGRTHRATRPRTIGRASRSKAEKSLIAVAVVP